MRPLPRPAAAPLLFVATPRFPTWESYATWLVAFLRVDFATATVGQALDCDATRGNLSNGAKAP